MTGPEDKAVQAFRDAFGGTPEALVQAPGRVNLIGEHTDYNDGFVLPCAIGYRTVVALRRPPDAQVRVIAVDRDGAGDRFSLAEPIERRPDAPWADYVRGMVRMLQEDGWPLTGADLAISGNVPQGAGLSSSASLQVALGQGFKQLLDLASLSQQRIAQLAQRAENHFVGVACGIMDQLVSACGQAGHALRIDCRSLHTEAVPLPAELALLIVHSRVRRGLVESAYNERRQQCEAAARHFGVAALLDLDEPTLHGSRHEGLDPLSWRRARHVVGENARVLQAAKALRAGDLTRLGQLMAASHASMRDDFGITTPHIDRLVAIAQKAIGPQGGARMTGGGFGGCVVALLPQARVEAVRAAIERDYRGPGGEMPWVWQSLSAAGAGALALP